MIWIRKEVMPLSEQYYEIRVYNYGSKILYRQYYQKDREGAMYFLINSPMNTTYWKFSSDMD